MAQGSLELHVAGRPVVRRAVLCLRASRSMRGLAGTASNVRARSDRHFIPQPFCDADFNGHIDTAAGCHRRNGDAHADPRCDRGIGDAHTNTAAHADPGCDRGNGDAHTNAAAQPDPGCDRGNGDAYTNAAAHTHTNADSHRHGYS